jgi:hypothetical protein
MCRTSWSASVYVSLVGNVRAAVDAMVVATPHERQVPCSVLALLSHTLHLLLCTLSHKPSLSCELCRSPLQASQAVSEKSRARTMVRTSGATSFTGGNNDGNAAASSSAGHKRAREPEIHDDCSCAVCWEVLLDPVTLPCGHTLDQRCLQLWWPLVAAHAPRAGSRCQQCCPT